MRFFFHSKTFEDYTDKLGTEFPSAADAIASAVQQAGELMRDAPKAFWASKPWSLTVNDEHGCTVWQIRVEGVSTPAGEVLELTGITGKGFEELRLRE